MEKRWRVYHENDDLGLKTAKEIREALRQGTLDPFDKVSRENSNIREELIEVDEIFKETPDLSPTSGRFDSHDPNGTVVVEPRLKVSAPQNVAQFNSARSNARVPLPAYEEDERNDNTGRGNSTKRYYLIDKEKVLGPLSALEIQSLFNRKMLNIKVRVQKIGNEKTIPITQFIASYSGDRLKELTEDGHIPQQIGLGSPSSKVMNELARMANSRKVAKGRRDRAYLMMTLAGLILGAGVFLIYEQSMHRRDDRVSEAQDEPSREAALPKGNKGQRPRLVQKSPEVSPAPEIAPPPRKRVVREESVKEASPALAIPDAIRPRAPSPSESKQRENRALSPDRPVIKKRGPDPAVINRVAVQNPDLKATDSIPLNLGPISKAVELAGRIQKIGPLSFNVQALEACTSKCTLTLKDATGSSIRAVFFKSAYYDLLKTRSKAVFLTGNTKLDRGELTLFIQVVH